MTPRTFLVTYDVQAFSVTEKGQGQKLKVEFLSRIIRRRIEKSSNNSCTILSL